MKKIFTIIAAVAALSLTSCKDYLDINHSPNSPEESQATVDMALPAAEMALCARYGDVYRIIGGYLSEHYTQYFGTSNYLSYSQFYVSSGATTNSYVDMNRAIANANFVMDKAKEQELWGTYLAATCIKVFTYQALIDAYGETPYSEANQGKNNLSPKYDEGKDVYSGIIAELNEALGKINNPADYPVATNLLYNGEDATNWVKFGNALKLKLLMRVRAVSNVDAELTALVEEGNFPTDDVAWTCLNKNEKGKANPFYQEEFASYFGSTQKNCVLNVALYRTLSAVGDARLNKFFSVNSADGSYWGSISGYNMSLSNNYKDSAFCRPNAKYNDPVYLISLSEIYFWLSEYYQKVKNDAVNAQDYYEAAIEASFEGAGLSAANAADVIAAYPYSAAKADEYIGIQKWVALSGFNSFEAWCEMRRLGYPTFGGKKAEDIYNFSTDTLDSAELEPGELYTPYQVNAQVGANKLPQRWLYPQASIDYNPNCPAEKQLTEKVFWAK